MNPLLIILLVALLVLALVGGFAVSHFFLFVLILAAIVLWVALT